MNKQELLSRARVLAGQSNLDEEERAELDKINADLSTIKSKEDAARILAEAEADAAKEVERRIKEAADAARAEEAAKARRLQFGDTAPYQRQFADVDKFDELSAGETALVIDTLNSNGRRVSGSAFKALTLKIAELKNRTNTDEEQKGINYVQNAFKAHNPGIDLGKASEAVKAATDPMYTGGSGIGSDWVGTAYSSEIWSSIRAANVVFNRVPSQVVPDGYSSIYIPLESSDPTWYKVAEATASEATLKVPQATITASQMATANKQLTLGKLGARSLYTGEMNEDSLIPFASQLRGQLEKSGTEVLEHVMIDGDVETSANKNINSIDGTPSGDPYLIADGFRKLALVTTTANSRSAGGVFDITDFASTLKLMGTAGLNGADPTAVAFILDYNTMWAALNLNEIKTRDVFSPATIENGFLTRVYNTQVLYAFQMHLNAADRKANTSGKVATGTPANNTTGSILAVRFDQWKQAFKRRMTIETTRIANADSYEIVALVRWGMAYRDGEASAITYNVGI